MRDKVNEELKRLEKEDIIKGVTGKTTPWLNPLLIVPMGEHKIRICVDMRAKRVRNQTLKTYKNTRNTCTRK